MKLSVLFTAPRQVELRQEPRPAPGPEEALVETVVSAISPGTELLAYRGEVPSSLPLDETIAALVGDFSYPFQYGYAAVGRVVEVGAKVDPDWKGRQVFSFHPHESYFLAQVGELQPVRAGLSPEIAALLPSMETAVSFLMDSQPMIGERVVVFGQGIVGLLTTGLLARLPLTRLVTLDRYAIRRQQSLRLGAQASLDPAAAGVRGQLQDLLQGEHPGADLTLELSGDPRALEEAIAVTGIEGRILLGSWYGTKRVTLDLGGHFHRSRIRLISSQVSRLAARWTGRWSKPRRLQVAWAMLEEMLPTPLITHRFPIAEAAKAYRLLDENPGEAIQVLLTYEP